MEDAIKTKECPVFKMDCAIVNCNRYNICEMRINFINANKGYSITNIPYINHEDNIGE